MSNGLRADDLDWSSADDSSLSTAFAATSVNQMSEQDVKKAYDDLVLKKFGGDKSKARVALIAFASVVFKNGTHESLPSDLKCAGTLTWGTVKNDLDFTKKNKAMIVRFAMPALVKLAALYANSSENILKRQAIAYDLDSEFNALPSSVNFFGGNFNPDASPADVAKFLKFQKNLISKSEEKSKK